MPKFYVDNDVFSAALGRMMDIYQSGNRVVVCFSGGKDSTVCLELAREACRRLGISHVDVVMRDEEIMFPGTYEYCERVAQQPDVRFHWLIAGQPIVNAFNRENPYYWVFDPLLDPGQWFRKPPSFAIRIADLNIEKVCSRERFPPEPGKDLLSVIGLRTQESYVRRMGIMSSKGWLTAPKDGVRKARPIYDWEDSDVWRAIKIHGWDYSKAYDGMVRGGMPMAQMRIAPPALAPASLKSLQVAARVWPGWFARAADRLPGLRTAAMFGSRSIRPSRRVGETWEAAYWRNCVEHAPEWIAERAVAVAEHVVKRHAAHANGPFPDVGLCPNCQPGSWKAAAYAMYHGDPFCMKIGKHFPYMEPDFFRPGAGFWGGKPTF